MTFYRSIIKDSWLSMLKSKYLWFFGLFAVLLGNGGEYEIFFRSIGSDDKSGSIWDGFMEQSFVILSNISNIGKRFWENPYDTSIIILSYLLVLIIFIFVVWMINISQAAIVDATARQAREKENNIKIGLSKGILNFWPVFSLNLFLKILTVAGLALIGKFGNLLLDSFVFVVIIPLMIAISFIVKYAIAYVVVRKEKLRDSIKLALNLFKNNWIISLELAFLLYFVTIGAGLFFMFVSFNITKFYEVLAAAFPTSAFYIFVVATPLTLFAALAFIGALLSVFQITAWTKLFLELEGKGAISKIERVFGR